METSSNNTSQGPDTSYGLSRILGEKKADCDQWIQDYHVRGNGTFESQQLLPAKTCPPIWDSLMCWPETRAGDHAVLPCASYVPGFHENQNASRYCTAEGFWFSKDSNATWTNYSLCHTPPPPQIFLDWLPVIKQMSRVGYAVSFIALAFALTALVSMKRLRCPRNTLHIHLFLSFLLRAFMSLLKDMLFVDGVGLAMSIEADSPYGPIFNDQVSNWECKLVTSLWQYFILANYFWILMEGMYLHNLIFLALFTDHSAITGYIFLGWGCPLFAVLAWALGRLFLDDSFCWTTHTGYRHLFLLIRIPIILSVLLNFFFFVNIVRVLLLKLTSAVSAETRKYRYRKWARSTLVLVPLFGSHYALLLGMTYFATDPVVEVVWLFCDQFFASFQGFFVSLLFCLLNAEVRSEIKKMIRDRKRRNQQPGQTPSVSLHNIAAIARSTHEELLTTNGMTTT